MFGEGMQEWAEAALPDPSNFFRDFRGRRLRPTPFAQANAIFS